MSSPRSAGPSRPTPVGRLRRASTLGGVGRATARGVRTDSTLVRYGFYSGRYRRQIRLVGLALITWSIARSQPQPGLAGHHLVILISLVVAVGCQVAAVVIPGPLAVPRTAVGGLAAAVLTGFDPGLTSAALLLFSGLDCAAFPPLGQGAYLAAAAMVATVLATIVASQPLDDATTCVAVLPGYLLATTFRQYELRAEQAELRLVDLQRAELERTRAVHLAERAAAAREIHDILAHNLGALVMQLDAVNALLEADEPDLRTIRPVLTDAHRSAVDGLAEARQAVSSLRADTAPLEVLIRQLAEARGATLDVDGTPRPVPADVAVVVRRTVQEALTNSAKHAPGATPDIHLGFGDGSIHLAVSDGGRPNGVPLLELASTGGGYGLAGMQERAELIGADLYAGPDGPGWRVDLTIPDRRDR